MGKTKQAQLTVYLEPDQAAEFEALVATTRLQKSILLRDAVDLLLAKHRKSKAPRRGTARVQRIN